MTKSNERPQKSNGLYQCTAECIEVSRRSKEHATEKKGRVSQFKLSLEIVVDLLAGRGLVMEDERERDEVPRVAVPSGDLAWGRKGARQIVPGKDYLKVTTMDSGQTGERKGPTVGEASLLSQGAPPDENVEKGGRIKAGGTKRGSRVWRHSGSQCHRACYASVNLCDYYASGERRDHNTAEILGGPRHRDRAGPVRNRCCYVIGQAYWAFVSLTSTSLLSGYSSR
ncbi:hypothetical protein G5I_07964 [Acromyrmex echinatior]|uniref:Uncharacterized protein n=1 Tax=Acromyrmex echinatior TaxID=103372 RepID=F4WQ80_ACREC|nr:hypothetical protein G5I_07964 [Acromyrmex echinatior]